jgi:hypothetical protein
MMVDPPAEIFDNKPQKFSTLRRILTNIRIQVRSFIVEFRAEMRMKHLVSSISIYLNQDRLANGNLPVVRSVRDIAFVVGCYDMIDLEHALQTLIDTDKAHCFNIEAQLIESIIQANREFFVGSYGLFSRGPYSLFPPLERAIVDELSVVGSVEFWELNFVST